MTSLRIRPFKAVHPHPSEAACVSSVPYDVVSLDEVREIAAKNEDSFMRVVRSEVDLSDEISPYDKSVYQKAKENYERLKADGVLLKDDEPSFYLYRQCIGTHHQVGLVTCCHIDDYNNNRIRKHENTRKVKEDDRTNHVLGINANSGPVFLTYRDNNEINRLIEDEMVARPMFHFVAEDGSTHTGWRVQQQEALLSQFSSIDVAYVADGHHRSASASRAAAALREANPNHDGSEEYNWFLTVLFPSIQLRILPYNRVVLDLNDLSPEDFLYSLREVGSLTETDQPSPTSSGTLCVYLGRDHGGWLSLEISPQSIDSDDPIASLDVDLLQQRILSPILGIDDPRSTTRIDFVGGIRGTEDLEERVDSGSAAVAFSLFPTTINQLLDVADASLIMPPKSTWFEPKLRSGLFIHELC